MKANINDMLHHIILLEWFASESSCEGLVLDMRR